MVHLLALESTASKGQSCPLTIRLAKLDLEALYAEVATTPRRRVEAAAPSRAELAVLRLLLTRLSTQEMGRELSVSLNTVRSQVQAEYRKLEISSSAEAFVQARQLDRS